MNKTLILAISLTFVLAVSAFAQSYSVSYSDGTVQMKTANGWAPLAIGDAVPANASVRLSQSGSLELERGKSRITILKDGTYDIASLTRASEKSGSEGVGANISQKLQSLTSEKPKSTAAGGVRAAEQGREPPTWATESDSDEVRSEVTSLLAQKKYTEALKTLADAITDSSSPADQQEFTYLTGVVYYGAGQTVKAYRALEKVSADPSVQWYPNYILLKAQVLVDSPDFSGALNILHPFLTENPSGESAQIAYLLTYFCQKGLGNTAEAKAALETGYRLDPMTDTAWLIDQQRKAQ
jgi:tetratricopeptide (TPR) repeat protein